MKLWGKIFQNGKIKKDTVVEQEGSEALDECLREICTQFDIEKPVFLKKHQRELNEYGHTAFRPEDFIDSVNFDKFEIEIISKRH